MQTNHFFPSPTALWQYSYVCSGTEQHHYCESRPEQPWSNHACGRYETMVPDTNTYSHYSWKIPISPITTKHSAEGNFPVLFPCIWHLFCHGTGAAFTEVTVTYWSINLSLKSDYGLWVTLYQACKVVTDWLTSTSSDAHSPCCHPAPLLQGAMIHYLPDKRT